MTHIYTASVPGVEVKRIYDKMIEVFKEEDENALTLAALSLVLIIHNPDINGDQLKEAIMEVSKTVMMVATGIESMDAEELNPLKVN